MIKERVPSGILLAEGSKAAPMKYALHFIGQAFHGAGTVQGLRYRVKKR